MKGNIYTDERCPICQGKLCHDENRSTFFCPDHSDLVINPGKCKVKFGNEVQRRFRNYKEAAQFLAGLRFKCVEGTFDKRDYQKNSPLAFETQATRWLELKKEKVKPNTFAKNIKPKIEKAIETWGQRNVKTIRYADIEDFLYDWKGVGNKTKSNICSVLHDFFVWVNDREGIPIPKFPKVDYELGWRNIIDLQLQQEIIAEIKRICSTPKVWIGIKWLATYVAFRPTELRNMQERHIDINGYFVVPHPKEKTPKLIPMLDEDIQIYRSFPVGMPDLYFFRHDTNNGSAKAGDQFSPNMFYSWWKKACTNLGIEGVDLYGGTRHSTISALGEHFTMEQLKADGTMHKTNKAFERYFQSKRNKTTVVYTKIREIQKGKILKMKNKGKPESANE